MMPEYYVINEGANDKKIKYNEVQSITSLDTTHLETHFMLKSQGFLHSDLAVRGLNNIALKDLDEPIQKSVESLTPLLTNTT